LFGIDPESYPQTFSNFNIVEGRLLRPGETGILISESRREDLYEDYLDSLQEESTDQVSSALGAPDPSAVPEETAASDGAAVDQPDETVDEDAGFSEEELQA